MQEAIGIFRIRYRFENHPQRADEILLSTQELVIGSSPEADLTLPLEIVSRRHVRVFVRSGRVYVSDLNSSNGTFLNAERLMPSRDYEWLPGMLLRLPQVEFELIYQPPATQGQRAAVHLTVTPETARPQQTLTLTLQNQTTQPQLITMQGTPLASGLDVELGSVPNDLPAGQMVEALARVRKTRPHFAGGTIQVRFIATTVSGLFDTAEASIRLRPRYELLLLLLLPFVAVSVALALRPDAEVASVSTATATATLTAVAVVPTATPAPPSITPSRTFTPTPSPTSTLTSTPGCVNQCAALRWGFYSVQPGDTLSSLAQGAAVSVVDVVTVNCLPNADAIFSGQSICFPRPPGFPDLAPTLREAGIRDFASPYPRFVTFQVDVVNVGRRTATGPVRVVSISAGSVIGDVGGDGWSCAITPRTFAAFECVHPGPLAAGSQLPSILVAHQFGTQFAVQVIAPSDNNPANDVASRTACEGNRCVELAIWRQNCATNPASDLQHTPAAPDACEQWLSRFVLGFLP